MTNRKLGQTGIEVSSISFGAWAIGGWYWGGSDDKVAISAIRTAIDHGISAFDTAPVYGFGRSETVLGQAIKGRRDKVVIMTKCGLRWDSEEGAHFFDVPPEEGNKKIFRNLRKHSIVKEVEDSLKRMKIDEIDLLQCHWPDPSHPIEETCKALAQLVNQGKVRAVGVSNFSVEQLETAASALGSIPLASNQPRYSLLNRRIERDILPWMKQNNVSGIAYSPIERGLLAGAVPPERTFADTDGRSWEPLFKVENRKKILTALSDMDDIRANHNCTWAQLSAAWVTNQAGIATALVGARTPEQAIENAKAMAIQLTTEESQALANGFSQLKLDYK